MSWCDSTDLIFFEGKLNPKKHYIILHHTIATFDVNHYDQMCVAKSHTVIDLMDFFFTKKIKLCTGPLVVPI